MTSSGRTSPPTPPGVRRLTQIQGPGGGGATLFRGSTSTLKIVLRARYNCVCGPQKWANCFKGHVNPRGQGMVGKHRGIGREARWTRAQRNKTDRFATIRSGGRVKNVEGFTNLSPLFRTGCKRENHSLGGPMSPHLVAPPHSHLCSAQVSSRVSACLRTDAARDATLPTS